MATNVKFEIKGNILTATIDLSKKFGVSGSGKSEIIATTGGNVAVEGTDGVYIGINAYTKIQK